MEKEHEEIKMNKNRPRDIEAWNRLSNIRGKVAADGQVGSD